MLQEIQEKCDLIDTRMKLAEARWKRLTDELEKAIQKETEELDKNRIRANIMQPLQNASAGLKLLQTESRKQGDKAKQETTQLPKLHAYKKQITLYSQTIEKIALSLKEVEDAKKITKAIAEIKTKKDIKPSIIVIKEVAEPFLAISAPLKNVANQLLKDHQRKSHSSTKGKPRIRK